MKNIILSNDIKVYYIQAKSFPEGITDAFRALEKSGENFKDRPYFGISSMKGSEIIYRAGIQILNEEEEKKIGQNIFIIPKGEYSTMNIKNFRKNISEIAETFKVLLTTPGADMEFPCIEWYENHEDVLCMVKLKKNT